MRYFIKLAYKGTNYHGWQFQPHCISVQSEMERCLSVIFKNPITVVGCGRTDAGVHAKEFYAHFDTPTAIIDKQKTIWSLNHLLGKEIVIYDIFPVAANAHARFDAVYRRYEYHLTFQKDPFYHEYRRFLFHTVNLEKMKEAAAILFDYRDFEAFSKVHSDVKHFDCNIFESRFEEKQQDLIYHVAANRFLRNMVRAIVGTLLLVGKEKISISDFRAIIESKDRSKAGKSAEAHALFLAEVRYKKD